MIRLQEQNYLSISEKLAEKLKMAYTKADLGDSLPLLASGKVRELYVVDPKTLLFVASDRISAYDVIMQNVQYNPFLMYYILPNPSTGSAK